jgi:hypothetical protein
MLTELEIKLKARDFILSKFLDIAICEGSGQAYLDAVNNADARLERHVAEGSGV